jgi:DNA-binding NtrC family response regulator
MARILIIDDEPRILSLLDGILQSNGHRVSTARDGLTGLEQIGQTDFDIVILDGHLPDMESLDVYDHIGQIKSNLPVIFLTNPGAEVDLASRAEQGPIRLVSKPFKVDVLLSAVDQALQGRVQQEQRAKALTEQSVDLKFDRLIAGSPAMERLCAVLQRVAPASTTVLINGESGTGKEVVARIIHEQSRRRDNPFVAVNCAALPEHLLESEMFGHVRGSFTGATADKTGLFEAAEGGTLLLDEVSSLPLGLQTKLLRVLQEREIRKVGDTKVIPIDVRVLAASNADLSEMVKENTFRSDLFYRLAVIPVELPPLRDRKEDVLPLTYHFLRRECLQNDIRVPQTSPEAEHVLQTYDWPGNVRELENAVRYALTFLDGNTLTPAALPPRLTSVVRAGNTAVGNTAPAAPTASSDQPTGEASLKSLVRKTEQAYIEQAVEAAGGDKEAAAKQLNISLSSLYRKLPPE